MIERLQRALEHIEEVPDGVQEELAEQIEEYLQEPVRHEPRARSFAGIWSDLPDDMEETLLRWRRETPPTPPVEEQLRWAERGLTVVTLDSDYTRVPGLLVLLLDRSALV